jgi:hypothetical protein
VHSCNVAIANEADAYRHTPVPGLTPMQAGDVYGKRAFARRIYLRSNGKCQKISAPLDSILKPHQKPKPHTRRFDNRWPEVCISVRGKRYRGAPRKVCQAPLPISGYDPRAKRGLGQCKPTEGSMTWVSLSISILGGVWFALGAWLTTLPRNDAWRVNEEHHRAAESNAFWSH